MVARVRSDGALIVTFQRDGEDPQQVTVPDGVQALATAVYVLSTKERLYPGDRLHIDDAASPSILPPEV
jgi:hypothetical protein